jgi:HEAT repeat protein
LLLVCAGAVFPSGAGLSAAQVPFDAAVRDLASPDARIRLRTVQMLKDAAYPEAALPLARLVTDPDDAVQLEAIAAELNIFLAKRIVTRRRVGLLIEKRTAVAADALFNTGPLAIGSRTVPLEVLDALRAAGRDDNPRVRLEAVYAFGVLGVEPRGARRRELLRAGARDLAAMVNAVDPYHRYAALRVIGRVLERRGTDAAADEYVGDVIINSLNEEEKALQRAAMQALGALRHERAVQGLMDLFAYYEKGEMAETALDAVAHIGHPSSVPLLTLQLASKNDVAKGIAVEGLARAGDPARLDAIGAALATERNSSLQLAGSFAAVMLSAEAAQRFDPIVEALAGSRLHDQAFWYLVEAAPGRTRALSRYLQDPDPEVRAGVIDALGLSDDPAALAVVEPLAGDTDDAVAAAAERAIARLRQPR